VVKKEYITREHGFCGNGLQVVVFCVFFSLLFLRKEGFIVWLRMKTAAVLQQGGA
jgi:hypothetical protein